MPSPDVEKFAGRPFSFYPAIRNVEHNEWTFQRATWSEILVHNTKSGNEIWVPRQFLGEISQVEEPVMIVGLGTELEYKGGGVWPYKRKVFEMPGAFQPAPTPAGPDAPATEAPPPSRESAAEKKIGLLVLASLGVFIALAAATVFLTRSREAGGRVTYETIVQQDLQLTANDDYFAVKRALGEPATERWKSAEGERQYQALEYPDRELTAILMGPERDDVRYIGAKNQDWRNVHTVTLPGGTDTASILQSRTFLRGGCPEVFDP